jgi:DNA-binding CsgD family transcriptional regulator
VRRALQLRSRLAHVDAQPTASDSLSQIRLAVFVVTGAGANVEVNREAERLLRIGDVLRGTAGQLSGPTPDITEHLLSLIEGAAATARGEQGSTGGSFRVARPGRPPAAILVAPFREVQNGLGAAVPCAIILVQDVLDAASRAAELQTEFGLTPAEATVADHLISGWSVAEIAHGHNLSINTVRTHLKQIFMKTGTGRQAEFVAVALRGARVRNAGSLQSQTQWRQHQF